MSVFVAEYGLESTITSVKNNNTKKPEIKENMLMCILNAKISSHLFGK